MSEVDPIHHLDMAVGEMSRAWSELEEGLVLALGRIARLPSNDVTDAILRMLPVGSRLEAIEMAADSGEHEEAWVAEVQSLCAYVGGTLKARRNLLIHGRWLDPMSATSVALRDMKPKLRKAAVKPGNRRLDIHRDAHVGYHPIAATTDAMRQELTYLAHLVLWLGGQGELSTLQEKRPPRHLQAQIGESLLRDRSSG